MRQSLGGKAEYIKDLVFQIFFNGINRPIPIVDQAVYNVLLQTQPYKGVTFFANQLHGWACQAGTTVDPSKIEGFRPNLTEAEPVWKDGKVYTADGNLFSIVHQYDRVPEWKKLALLDPQTSGGLLLSVAAEQADSILAKLNSRFPRAQKIGQVENRGTHPLVILE